MRLGSSVLSGLRWVWLSAAVAWRVVRVVAVLLFLGVVGMGVLLVCIPSSSRTQSGVPSIRVVRGPGGIKVVRLN